MFLVSYILRVWIFLERRFPYCRKTEQKNSNVHYLKMKKKLERQFTVINGEHAHWKNYRNVGIVTDDRYIHRNVNPLRIFFLTRKQEHTLNKLKDRVALQFILKNYKKKLGVPFHIQSNPLEEEWWRLCQNPKIIYDDFLDDMLKKNERRLQQPTTD